MANIHLYCQEGGKQRVKSETLSERNIEGEEKVQKLYYLYISVLLVCFLVLFFQFPISVYLESANKKSQDFFLGIFVPFQFSLSLSHSIHACSLSDFFSRMEIALMQSPVQLININWRIARFCCKSFNNCNTHSSSQPNAKRCFHSSFIGKSWNERILRLRFIYQQQF